MAPELPVGRLFGRPVVDSDGRTVGHVHDARLRRDGPFIPGFGPAYRIEGLLVRLESIAARLGIDRPNIAGPWPLDVWGRRAARRARFIPWHTLTFEDDVLRTRLTAVELPPAYE